jgi:hypothetical protein
VRDDGGDDRVDEGRRHGDRSAADEAQVVRLEAAGGDDGIAKGEEDEVVVARIGVGDRRDLAGLDRAHRRGEEALVQAALAGAGSATRASSASASIGRKKSSPGAQPALARRRFGRLRADALSARSWPDY